MTSPSTATVAPSRATGLVPPHATSLAPPRQAATRDRFLGFAFAAADVLVEANLDGVITFVAGACRVRFGVEGSALVGQHVASLIAAGDQTTFTMALSAMPLRGRIAPLTLRTSDPGQTVAVVAAMLVPDPPARLCFTIGPLPSPGAEPRPGAAPRMEDAVRFNREAEAVLRGGGSATIGLLELKDWQDVRERLTPEAQRKLRKGIGKVLAGADGRALASEIAEGRYGVLAQGDADIQAMIAQLSNLMRASPATRQARVEGTELPLERGGLGAPQAARALRYALSRFADAGTEAAAAIGTKGGLAGILAQADMRARAMREVIAARRFRLVFQPVVGLSDRAVHHYEALLRPIPTPGTPAHTPQDFVTFAEAVGLSEELDWAVLELALMALRAAPTARVAVNVSGLSMQSAGFRARVLARVSALSDMLGANGGGRLLIELTETAEIEDMQGAADSIAELRAAGVPVCLDDFGAGAAAFRYLRAFHLDYVKIDGAYVRAALASPRERGFVAAMVELAGSVNAQVVAEMIETEEQAELMRNLGVQHGQGWLFGRPGMLPGLRR